MNLSKQTRKQIISSVINHRTEKRLKALVDEAGKMAQDAANELYPKATQRWIDAAPIGGLATVGRVKLRNPETKKFFSVSSLKSPFVTCNYEFSLKYPVKILAADQHKNSVDILSRHLERYNEIVAEVASIKKQRESIKATLAPALDSFRTVKQVLNAYPELEQFMPSMAPAGGQIVISREAVADAIGATA